MNLRSWLLLIASFVLPAVAWMGINVYLRSSTSLPRDVTTFDQYLARMPAPEQVYLVERDGVRYYVFVGPLPPSPAVASGHPRYVFDREGRVVDWTADVGDDTGYIDRWSNATSYGTVEVAEAVRELSPRARSN